MKTVRRFSFLSVCLLLSACNHTKPITQDELVRRSQGMMDAVPAGDQTLWKQYFADDVLYFGEKGRAMDKAALMADLTPMPKGYGGTIKIDNPKSVITPTYAVVSFDENETRPGTPREISRDGHLGAAKWRLANRRRPGAALLRRPSRRHAG